jgi:sulfur relay (sulfurtransferase) DsrC/TusE family protein
MELPERDGDGYLTEMSNWTPEVARAMAEADGVQLDDVKWQQILKAREYYDQYPSANLPSTSVKTRKACSNSG